MIGRKLSFLSLLLLIFLSLSLLNGIEPLPNPSQEAHPLKEWVAASNQLGVSLFKELRLTHKKNCCLSPFGISTALGVLYLASGEEGQAEIEKLFSLPHNQ